MNPLQLGWNCLGWYFAVYGIVTWITMRFSPKLVRWKVLTWAVDGTGWERFCTLVSRAARLSIMLLSLFIPVAHQNPRVIAGTLLYMVGLILATIALWQYSHVPTDAPITNGIYCISRHPMQVMFYLLLIGTMVIAGNLLYSGVSLLYLLSSYPSLAMQERFCIDRYGNTYWEYLQRTPKILLWKAGKEGKS